MDHWSDYVLDMIRLICQLYSMGKHDQGWFDEQNSSWDEEITQAIRPYLPLRDTFVNAV